MLRACIWRGRSFAQPLRARDRPFRPPCSRTFPALALLPRRLKRSGAKLRAVIVSWFSPLKSAPLPNMRSRRARLNTGQSIRQPGSCEHARLGVMTPRERETFPPVTLGQIRGHGCRNLLVYCESVWCNHSAVMNADPLPDELPVRALCPRRVWTACSGPRCGRTGRRIRQSGLTESRSEASCPGSIPASPATDCPMCNNCRLVLPYVGLELGNPTVTFVGPRGSAVTMRDGVRLDLEKQ